MILYPRRSCGKSVYNFRDTVSSEQLPTSIYNFSDFHVGFEFLNRTGQRFCSNMLPPSSLRVNFVHAVVTGRSACVDFVGRKQDFWWIRNTERKRVNRVLCQTIWLTSSTQLLQHVPKQSSLTTKMAAGGIFETPEDTYPALCKNLKTIIKF